MALLALSLAGEASALPLCEEGRPESTDGSVSPDSPDSPDDDDGPLAEPAEHGAPEEPSLILPCVLAEMGPSCADATFYLVTTTGILLCQMDIPALAAGGLPQVERTPARLPASSAFFAAALPVEVAAVPPALVRELPAADVDDAGLARDGFARSSCPPS